MNFMSDGDETESEYNMVDEGAIAVMSMDEIRNMKNMQIEAIMFRFYEIGLVLQFSFPPFFIRSFSTQPDPTHS